MRLFSNHRPKTLARAERPVEVKLIILEDGAQAFDPSSSSSEDAIEVVVLVQSAGEHPQDLVLRAKRRLAVLERSDRVVVEAVIAAGCPVSESVLAARASLADAVLAHLSQRGSGELVLAAGSDARAELRHELMALAGSLTGDITSPAVCIRVLFGAPPRESEHKSGVHAPLLEQRGDAHLIADLTG